LLTQGMVLNHIYSRRTDKGGIEYFAPDEVEPQHDSDGKITGAKSRTDSQPVDYQGMGTMSKSKRNGVDPQALIEKYGADTARFFIMFASPPEQTLEWSDAGVEGAHRFLKRIWAAAKPEYGQYLLNKAIESESYKQIDPKTLHPDQRDVRQKIHLLLKQINFDFGRHQFNTVSSGGMKALNELPEAIQDVPGAVDSTITPHPGSSFEPSMHARYTIIAEGLWILLRVLHPICPHITDHLWRELGYGDDILKEPWPEPDEKALKQDEIELVLQVNGKMRGNVRVAADADRAAIEAAALAHEAARKHTVGLTVKKVVLVPGRLVNIVAG
ncbi:MAG TPA: class I tRNA ligase family protein, partial [Gammaproteobacteria bacterium]|nr:class I tRNA ligase family protein [Gammaproteobacteria bacterium]